MLKFLIILIIFLKLPHFVKNTKLDIEFITDYINVQQSKNVKINIYFCSVNDFKIKLYNSMFENGHHIAIYNMKQMYINNNIQQNILYILDLDCRNYYNILKKANSEKLFLIPNTWIFLTKSVNISQEFYANFSSLKIYQNTNIMLVKKFENGTYFLYELYKEFANSNLHLNYVTKWSKTQKFQNAKLRIIAEERKNLNKIVLGASIVILENNTLNHLDDYRFKHIDSITKVNYILINHLLEYLNATLKIYPVDSWGYLNKTTNIYSGMIGSIQQNQSEIGGTALFMTIERLPIIDYIAMTTPTKVRFVFRQPPLSYQQNIFTLPFTRELWISSFFLIIICIILLYSTVYYEWNNTELAKGSENLRNSISDVVMLTFAAVSQQGSTIEPRSGSGKIIMIFTFIALMFLYVSYSANIVALLQSSSTNIRTLEDLLESRLKLGADDTVYNRYYMNVATEPTRKAIYEKKISPKGEAPHFLSLEEGVENIRHGFYAFHMELGRGYKLIADTFYENEKCGIQEINYLDVKDAYLAIKRNSIYKEMITIGLRKLRENGIQHRELEKIYTKKPECLTAGGSFVSVGLIDSYAAFLFLGAGIGLSLIILLLEIIFSKNNQIDKFCLKLI